MALPNDEARQLLNRFIAIGDIHGHSLALHGLLSLVSPRATDVIVTVGDYINRGPDSRGVIDALIELGRQCTLIPLLGNHEEMLLDSRNDAKEEVRWKSLGGDATSASYGPGAGIGQIPQAHWNFLSNCRPYYETEHFVFTHANYCWYSPVDQQPVSLLRWLSLDESSPRPHLNGKTFILGHTPGVIRDLKFCRCIDTACGFGGCLTAMEVQTRHFWQVNENGQLITASVGTSGTSR